MYSINNNEIIISDLIADMIAYLKKEKQELFEMNKRCTQDTLYWIEHDWNYAIEYLSQYEVNNNKFLRQNRKSKGDVLLILSYNEPLLLAVIPIVNALIAGNVVRVRPSRRNIDIVNNIWIKSGIAKKHNLPLEIISDKDYDIKKEVKKSCAVYFFGGHEVAKKIAKICSQFFVEFYPEIEAADCKVIFYNDLNKINIKKDVRLTMHESFSHCGQICQRIHGIVLVGDIYERYVEEMKKAFRALGAEADMHISKEYNVDRTYVNGVNVLLNKSKPKEIIYCENKHQLPVLIIEPSKRSRFVDKAFFLPTLWIVKVNDQQEAIDFLNTRSYHLGLNIMSDSSKFIQKITDHTRFSRYTINTSHSDVRMNEGWGGVWPSGFSGYQSWIHHFSDPYVKITS